MYMSEYVAPCALRRTRRRGRRSVRTIESRRSRPNRGECGETNGLTSHSDVACVGCLGGWNRAQTLTASLSSPVVEMIALEAGKLWHGYLSPTATHVISAHLPVVWRECGDL